MPVVKTSAKGQVVIPAEIREKIGLRPGGKVLVALGGDGKVVIEPVPNDPIAAACGMLAGGPSLTQTLLQEQREEDAREKKKRARFLRATRVPKQRARVRKG